MDQEKPGNAVSENKKNDGQNKKTFFDKVPVSNIIKTLSFCAIVLTILKLFIDVFKYIFEPGVLDGLVVLQMLLGSLTSIVPLFLCWGVGQIIKIVKDKNEN